MSFPVTMNKGEILRSNGLVVQIRNQFTLKRDAQGEYYEIDFCKLKIMIDKQKIYDFLSYNGHLLEWNLDAKAKFIIAKMPNGNEINLINYLAGDYDLLGNRVFNVMIIRNDQPFNFRSSNIMKKSKTAIKQSKIIQNPDKFFGNEEIIVLNSFSGHIKEQGQTGGKERNQYRLITLAKDRQTPHPPKYYEVYLDKKGKLGEEFTFLIDEADISILSSIRVKNPFYQNNKDNHENILQLEEEDEKDNDDIHNTEYNGMIINYDDNTVKDEYIKINNPTWHLYQNQYITMVYTNIYKNREIRKNMYIHRYLLQDSLTEENYTIDHINGNKFDNRRSNLRATNMSVQNMNRDMIKRNKTLSTIINSFAKAGTDTLVKLSFDNLEFIVYFNENVKTKKGITIRNGFSIEFTPARIGTDKGIEDSSSQAIIFKDNPFMAIKVKLAHAISIRYLRVNQYSKILDHSIDNQKFTDSNAFKLYSNKLITELLDQSYSIDTFLDYMNTLNIPKYSDPRMSFGLLQQSDNVNDVVFNYIQYVKVRDKYDIDIPYGKDATGKLLKIRKSGLGISKDTITDADKKAYALVQRYNAIVEIQKEFDSMKTQQTETATTDNNAKVKSLADITLEGIKFKSLSELRQHTETFINKLLTTNNNNANSATSATSAIYTLESFAEHINVKAANKKVKLEVAKIN